MKVDVRDASVVRGSELAALCVGRGALADVGDQADTAFSRAFRREFGAPPATWRRNQTVQAQVRQPVA